MQGPSVKSIELHFTCVSKYDDALLIDQTQNEGLDFTTFWTWSIYSSTGHPMNSAKKVVSLFWKTFKAEAVPSSSQKLSIEFRYTLIYLSSSKLGDFYCSPDVCLFPWLANWSLQTFQFDFLNEKALLDSRYSWSLRSKNIQPTRKTRVEKVFQAFYILLSILLQRNCKRSHVVEGRNNNAPSPHSTMQWSSLNTKSMIFFISVFNHKMYERDSRCVHAGLKKTHIRTKKRPSLKA